MEEKNIDRDGKGNTKKLVFIHLLSMCVCERYRSKHNSNRVMKGKSLLPIFFPFFSSYIIYTEDVCIERKEAELTVSKSTKDVSLLSSQIAKICLYTILFLFPLTIHVNVRGTTTSVK
jgi:hypothetical protein